MFIAWLSWSIWCVIPKGNESHLRPLSPLEALDQAASNDPRMILYFTGTSKNRTPKARAHFAGAFWGYLGVLLDTTWCSHIFRLINSPQQTSHSPRQRQVAWCFPTWPTAHLWCPRGEPQSCRPRDMDCHSPMDQMGHPPQGYRSARDLRRQRPSRTWSTHSKLAKNWHVSAETETEFVGCVLKTFNML